MTAKVSIGIPVYNGASTIARCLDSLIAQDMREIEVLISDNDSTDGTSDICRRYAERDPRIRVVRQERNLGMVGNYVFVLRNTSAPFFMWLHDDDYYADGRYVSRLFEKASSGGYALVFPRIRKYEVVDGRESDLAPRGGETLDGTRFQRHWTLMRRHYLGYQIAYGLASREMLDSTVSLWFQSQYRPGIPDEEPYLHFVLSRFECKFVPESVYCKDMSGSTYNALGLSRTFMPLMWQTVATAGVIAQSEYTAGQKLALMALKAARSSYVLADLAAAGIRARLRRTPGEAR
jgi:glycosyltransferase involved in cell wall biosynthesis